MRKAPPRSVRRDVRRRASRLPASRTPRRPDANQGGTTPRVRLGCLGVIGVQLDAMNAQADQLAEHHWRRADNGTNHAEAAP